jgi:hypothetical protein
MYGIEAVVEQGTGGAWYYRKWTSGKAECWCHNTYSSVAVNRAWGSLYESVAYNLTFPTNLFTAVDSCVLSLGGTGGAAAFLEIGKGLSTAETSNFWFVRPVSTDSSTYTVNAVAYGRWK